MSGECKAGHYTSNMVVTHFPLVCFGGHGQPVCKHLLECMLQNNMNKSKKRIIKESLSSLRKRKGYEG